MLLFSVSFVDRCWSYVITVMLFTYGLQLTILMILIPSRCPAEKYGLRIPWWCCLLCCNRTAKSHPLGREGGCDWWLRNKQKKMHISIIWGIFCKVGEAFISLCKDCETFSEILCTVWLPVYKNAHSSWNNCCVWRSGLSWKCFQGKGDLSLWEKMKVWLI